VRHPHLQTERLTVHLQENEERLPPLADARLAFLDRLNQILWISDIDTWRYRWANRAGLDFWHAGSVEELVARRLPVSDTIRTTFLHVRERAAHGETVWLDHTVYPKGVPTRIQTYCSAYPLSEGRTGLFIEARRLSSTTDPEVLRASEAVRYAPLVVTTHALDGMTLTANALSRRTFGYRFRLHDLFEDAVEAEEILDILRRGDLVSRDARLHTAVGARWFAIEGRRIPDPVTGADAVILSASDVTARRRAEAAKDELISVVSHELRTPLTAIRGALSLLQHGRAIGEEGDAPELLEIATENTARLGRLLDDLLDVQKIGSGGMDLVRVPMPLRPLVARAITLLAPLSRARELHVTLRGGDAVVLDIDETRMLQVLSNLLSNAIKHSPRGGAIHVEITVADGARARVSITDEGPGVPPSFRERIFGRFEQADASDARSLGGAGLGLYIAKTLVEHHGGRLDFEDHTLRGATFYFELPLLA
jgi:signal transduction histidine kinase